MPKYTEVMTVGEVTRLLHAIRDGEFRPGTMQATALVHEVYVRLAGADVEWQSRGHFFATAARAMRRILVDRARAQRRLKRGGEMGRVEFTGEIGEAGEADVDLLALDEALERLEAIDERKARVVMLRFFVGMRVEETAEVLGVSPATVKNDWAFAKAWLHKSVQEGSDT